MENVKSKMTETQGVIVWAIDPFEKETKPDTVLVRRLMDWANASGFELQPVHILSVPNSKSEIYFGAGSVYEETPAAQKASEQYLRDLGVKGARPVEILVDYTSSGKGRVEKIVNFSKTVKAPWIIISSHGRHGLGRIFLGSFAESLLLQSTIPVLFLTHLKTAEESEKPISHVLFPTDFSDYSREAFLRFLDQAEKLNAEIIVFHSLSSLSIAASGFGAVPVVIPQNYFTDQAKWANEEGTRWTRLAHSHGISAKVIIKDEGLDDKHVGSSILKLARQEGTGLIAMASLSGAFTSFVLGSVARNVFRSNQCPVWVYGPKALEKRHTIEQTASA